MAPPAAVEGGDEQQQQAQGLGQMFQGMIRIVVIHYFASKFFSSNKPSSPGSDPSLQISNLFQKAQPLDMWFYLSEHEKFNDFGNEDLHIWHESNIPYAVWGAESTRTLSLKYYPSQALKHNGSLYAHVFFARSGNPADPNDPEYQPWAETSQKQTKRRAYWGTPKTPVRMIQSLEGVEEPQVDLKERSCRVHFLLETKYHYNLVDFTKYSQCSIPPNVAPHMNIEPTTGNYYPTVYFNEFWLLRDKLIALSDTGTELPLHLEVAPISMTKWQSMEGLSVKLVVVSFICQLIIFLYLLDNDTSWMILASSGIGVCIEFWKIGKAMHIEVDRSGSIPKLKFSDRNTYAANKTKEYDDLAMKYLSFVLFVLVACSSVYSLMYETHKSWYSWILSSLASCVYMFDVIFFDIFVSKMGLSGRQKESE